MTTSSGLSKPNMYKISRGRTLNGEPNPIDVYIGQRIRVRRQLLGLSQEALAKKIGITFQQVQKYERGMNRMGSSRLWDMAQVLGVSVNFFFEDMAAEIAAQSPRSFFLPDSKPCRFEQPTAAAEDPMTRTETLELVKDYYRINNRNLAKRLKQCIHEAAKTMYNQKNDDEPR